MTGEIIRLGARLRQRREELGLTQAQAARELEVARTAYRLWEMEAARPSPDRWRMIARWLGLSVTALLLADELIDEDEAAEAKRAAQAVGLTDEGWDQLSATAEGDFFAQQRSAIADQARMGRITADQAAGLREVLARVQDATEGSAPHGWHPGWFRKRFPSTTRTPALARAALTATVVGIPQAQLEEAALLVSELVTNSVTHSESGWVDVQIVLSSDRLRIEVADQDPRALPPPGAVADRGWGLVVVAELATRWGVERRPDGKAIWVELDLTAAPDQR